MWAGQLLLEILNSLVAAAAKHGEKRKDQAGQPNLDFLRRRKSIVAGQLLLEILNSLVAAAAKHGERRKDQAGQPNLDFLRRRKSSVAGQLPLEILNSLVAAAAKHMEKGERTKLGWPAQLSCCSWLQP